jgi:proline racemase
MKGIWEVINVPWIFDYTKGTYYRNIYAEINPNVVKELGDVGNDIKIYGSKLYIVVNVSNKIEVLDAKTAKRITLFIYRTADI